MERTTRTRPPTPAERHAARALGRAEPTEVTEDVTPTAALHAARLTGPAKSPKPSGMQTAAWYASRATGKAAPLEPDTGGVEESRPLPRWARRMVYRPGGGDAA